MLRVVREQDVEDEIRCPRYLIGVTGEGAARLRQDPEARLPLCQLIFLNRDDKIRLWFLTNSGQDTLDLMVIESPPEDGEDLDETSAKINPPSETRAPPVDACDVIFPSSACPASGRHSQR